MRVVRLTIIVLVLLVGAGCGRAPAPTPTPTQTPQPTAALATATPVPASDTTGNGAVNAASQSLPSVAATEQTPVVVENAAECALESDLDLAGYPDLEATMGCAVGAAHTDAVGFNEFGPGPDYNRFMLWLSWEGQIVVLFPNGSWRPYPDTWTEDEPSFSCNPLGGDEASPPLPRRGFGKLWCAEQDVQAALGTIEVEERLCQHAVTQEFERGEMIACFEDATIRYFKLFNDRTWEAVVQP